MTRPKSDKILSEWRAVTERARQPRNAPTSATTYRRLPVGMAALAALVVIVVVVGSRVVAPSVGSGSVGSAEPSASATESATVAGPSATPTPGAPPSPASTPATFKTAGVAANWQGFTWTTLPADGPILTAVPGIQVIPWRGGYVAYGTTNGASIGVVWTSADGETWQQVTDIVAPRILVAVSPTGLVAFADDPSAASPTATVWTSTDGVAWHNAGSPTGLAFIDSIAGTSAGLVATGHTLDGTGKYATAQFGVAFSTDGLSWAPVTIASGLAWDYVGPAVQSGNGRFFLMGGYTGGTASDARPLLASLTQPGRYGSGILGATMTGTGGLWWSDDGRTWTRSKFGGYYVAGLDFGRSGILMHTSSRNIPGGTGLQLSTDGGKTWKNDATYGPLGVSVCGQGECSGGADGAIGSNGSFFVAVKSDGQAWISYDGQAWTSIAWGGPTKSYSLLVLPRGVVSDGQYGAAK